MAFLLLVLLFLWKRKEKRLGSKDNEVTLLASSFLLSFLIILLKRKRALLTTVTGHILNSTEQISMPCSARGTFIVSAAEGREGVIWQRNKRPKDELWRRRQSPQKNEPILQHHSGFDVCQPFPISACRVWTYACKVSTLFALFGSIQTHKHIQQKACQAIFKS